MRISLIVPCWRELSAARTFADRWSEVPEVELIFGLAREAADLASFLSTRGVKASISTAAGRGRQMNEAVRLATGEILLFHHIDSVLTPEHLASLCREMGDASRVGGAFYRKFDERHPQLRCLEPIERWHNRSFGALYGDQSLFVRRSVFEALGGYADFPLMEDVEFSRRLRRAGSIVMLDPPMESSPRRHLEGGAWRTTLTNVAMLLGYHLGVPPAALHRWYYRKPFSANPPPASVQSLAAETHKP
ncbi:MAG: glycosyltransferase family 2 protein [Chthoniobacteraceae bacterium]